MNLNSVAHTYVQNQSTPSWIDDPFDLKGQFDFVKGVTMVSHEKRLQDYAQELVALRGKYECDQYYLDLTLLTDEEQNELARLYIEATDRETNECIYGDDFTINSEFNCALLALLQNDTSENRDRFAEVTRNNVITYYRKSLDEVLDQACHDYLCAQMNEAGYYAHQDRESGEVIWGKF